MNGLVKPRTIAKSTSPRFASGPSCNHNSNASRPNPTASTARRPFIATAQVYAQTQAIEALCEGSKMGELHQERRTGFIGADQHNLRSAFFCEMLADSAEIACERPVAGPEKMHSTRREESQAP